MLYTGPARHFIGLVYALAVPAAGIIYTDLNVKINQKTAEHSSFLISIFNMMLYTPSYCVW
jgi:hypothetical protein